MMLQEDINLIWHVGQLHQQKKVKIPDHSKTILFAPEDNENQYKEFGWTELHRNGKMNCIDGNHFLFVRRNPKQKSCLMVRMSFTPEPEFLEYGCTMEW